MGLTHDLCKIIHATKYESLGDECVDRMKAAIKDGIAVAIAGCKYPQIAISAEHMRSLGGAPQASVWGWGFKGSVVQAAYVNSAAMHVLDFEPMWKPPTHPMSPTVAVGFALAETQAVTGRQLIAAIANGLEIQGRLQYAAQLYVAKNLNFHPTGVAGIMGSTIVAADLLELDVESMQHALGVAASRAGALLSNIGSMVKCTHSGNAAASGLDAALLAKRGFTANPDVIEAARGGFEATYYPDGLDRDKLLGYGKPFRIVDPGVAIKLFPSQYSTHFAISAGLELSPQIPDKSKIASLRIVAPPLKHIDRPHPETGLDGKHSLQYTSAAAVLDGKVNIDTFSDERRFREDMVKLLAKTTLILDESISSVTHKTHMTVEVELQYGQRLSAVCRGPKGIWGVPLDPRDHRAKLEDCFSRQLPRERVSEVIDLLDHLEKQDSAGVRKIVALISGA